MLFVIAGTLGCLWKVILDQVSLSYEDTRKCKSCYVSQLFL